MPWGAANPSMVSGVALGPPPSQAHLLPYLHAGGPRASLSRESDFLDGRQMCCSSSCKAASCRRCLRAVTHGLPGGQSWGFAFLRCWQAGQAVLHASGVGNGAAELWAAHRAPRAAVCPPRPPLSAQHRVLLITQRMKSFSGTFLGLFWAALLALCCWPQRAQLTRGGGCGAARCFGCRLGSTGRSLWPQHSSGLCDTAKKCEKCKKKKEKNSSFFAAPNEYRRREDNPQLYLCGVAEAGRAERIEHSQECPSSFPQHRYGDTFLGLCCGSAAVGGWLPRALHCGSAPQRAASINAAPSAATAPGAPRSLCLWNATKPSPPPGINRAEPSPARTVVPPLRLVRPLPTPQPPFADPHRRGPPIHRSRILVLSSQCHGGGGEGRCQRRRAAWLSAEPLR